ncbi:MAG: hypothetical protein WCF65_04110 [Parachlamydiaceae bacterium]
MHTNLSPSSKENILVTPWKKDPRLEGGRRARFEIVQDPQNNILKIQRVSQNRMQRKEGSSDKQILESKEFSLISAEEFEAKKEGLAQLLARHMSLEESMNELKNQLTEHVQQGDAGNGQDNLRQALIEVDLEYQRALGIAPQLTPFSNEIKAAWETKFAVWSADVAGLATAEAAREHAGKLRTLMTQVVGSCRDEVSDVAHTVAAQATAGLSDFKREFSAIDVTATVSGEERKNGLFSLRQQLAGVREKVWDNLREEITDIGNDLATLKENIQTMATKQTCIEKEKRLDRALLSLWGQVPAQSAFQRFRAALPSWTDFIPSAWHSSLPKSLEKIVNYNAVITDYLKVYDALENKDEASESVKNLFIQCRQSNIDIFREAVEHEYFKAFVAVDGFTGIQKHAREVLADLLKQGVTSRILDEDSGAVPAQLTIERQAIEKNLETLKTLHQLAIVRDQYLLTMNDLKVQVDGMTGTEKEKGEEALGKVSDILKEMDKTKRFCIENAKKPFKPSSVAFVESRLKQIMGSMEKIVGVAGERKTIREELTTLCHKHENTIKEAQELVGILQDNQQQKTNDAIQHLVNAIERVNGIDEFETFGLEPNFTITTVSIYVEDLLAEAALPLERLVDDLKKLRHADQAAREQLAQLHEDYSTVLTEAQPLMQKQADLVIQEPNDAVAKELSALYQKQFNDTTKRLKKLNQSIQVQDESETGSQPTVLLGPKNVAKEKKMLAVVAHDLEALVTAHKKAQKIDADAKAVLNSLRGQHEGMLTDAQTSIATFHAKEQVNCQAELQRYQEALDACRQLASIEEPIKADQVSPIEARLIGSWNTLVRTIKEQTERSRIRAERKTVIDASRQEFNQRFRELKRKHREFGPEHEAKWLEALQASEKILSEEIDTVDEFDIRPLQVPASRVLPIKTAVIGAAALAASGLIYYYGAYSQANGAPEGSFSEGHSTAGDAAQNKISSVFSSHITPLLSSAASWAGSAYMDLTGSIANTLSSTTGLGHSASLWTTYIGLPATAIVLVGAAGSKVASTFNGKTVVREEELVSADIEPILDRVIAPVVELFNIEDGHARVKAKLKDSYDQHCRLRDTVAATIFNMKRGTEEQVKSQAALDEFVKTLLPVDQTLRSGLPITMVETNDHTKHLAKAAAALQAITDKQGKIASQRAKTRYSLNSEVNKYEKLIEILEKNLRQSSHLEKAKGERAIVDLKKVIQTVQEVDEFAYHPSWKKRMGAVKGIAAVGTAVLAAHGINSTLNIHAVYPELGTAAVGAGALVFNQAFREWYASGDTAIHGHMEKLLSQAAAPVKISVEIEKRKNVFRTAIGKTVHDFHLQVEKKRIEAEKVKVRLGLDLTEVKRSFDELDNAMNALGAKATQNGKEVELGALDLNELEQHYSQLKFELVKKTSALKNIKDAENILKECAAFDKEVMSATRYTTELTSAEHSSEKTHKHLAKCQFSTAEFVSKGLTAIQDKMPPVAPVSTAEGAKSALKNAIIEISVLIKQARKMGTLSLIDQIKKLEEKPSEQRRAKRAFLDMLYTEAQNHTNEVASKLSSVRDLSFAEAVNKVFGKHRDKVLGGNTLKHILKGHRAKWDKTSDQGMQDPGGACEELDLLSIKDLEDYADGLRQAVKDGKGILVAMSRGLNQVVDTRAAWENQLESAKMDVENFNQNGQFLATVHLERAVKKAKEDAKLFDPLHEKSFDGLSISAEEQRQINARYYGKVMAVAGLVLLGAGTVGVMARYSSSESTGADYTDPLTAGGSDASWNLTALGVNSILWAKSQVISNLSGIITNSINAGYSMGETILATVQNLIDGEAVSGPSWDLCKRFVDFIATSPQSVQLMGSVLGAKGGAQQWKFRHDADIVPQILRFFEYYTSSIGKYTKTVKDGTVMASRCTHLDVHEQLRELSSMQGDDVEKAIDDLQKYSETAVAKELDKCDALLRDLEKNLTTTMSTYLAPYSSYFNHIHKELQRLQEENHKHRNASLPVEGWELPFLQWEIPGTSLLNFGLRTLTKTLKTSLVQLSPREVKLYKEATTKHVQQLHADIAKLKIADLIACDDAYVKEIGKLKVTIEEIKSGVSDIDLSSFFRALPKPKKTDGQFLDAYLLQREVDKIEKNKTGLHASGTISESAELKAVCDKLKEHTKSIKDASNKYKSKTIKLSYHKQLCELKKLLGTESDADKKDALGSIITELKNRIVARVKEDSMATVKKLDEIEKNLNEVCEIIPLPDDWIDELKNQIEELKTKYTSTKLFVNKSAGYFTSKDDRTLTIDELTVDDIGNADLLDSVKTSMKKDIKDLEAKCLIKLEGGTYSTYKERLKIALHVKNLKIANGQFKHALDLEKAIKATNKELKESGLAIVAKVKEFADYRKGITGGFLRDIGWSSYGEDFKAHIIPLLNDLNNVVIPAQTRAIIEAEKVARTARPLTTFEQLAGLGTSGDDGDLRQKILEKAAEEVRGNKEAIDKRISSFEKIGQLLGLDDIFKGAITDFKALKTEFDQYEEKIIKQFNEVTVDPALEGQYQTLVGRMKFKESSFQLLDHKAKDYGDWKNRIATYTMNEKYTQVVRQQIELLFESIDEDLKIAMMTGVLIDTLPIAQRLPEVLKRWQAFIDKMYADLSGILKTDTKKKARATGTVVLGDSPADMRERKSNIRVKLDKLEKDLAKYVDRLESIDDLVTGFSDAPLPVPPEWRRLIEELIEKIKVDTCRLEQGLPWKAEHLPAGHEKTGCTPPALMEATLLAEYETLVNDFTNNITVDIEYTLQLEAIENLLTDLVKARDGRYGTSEKYQIVLEVAKEVLKKAYESLGTTKNPWVFMNSVLFATQTITNQSLTDVFENPWVELYKYREGKLVARSADIAGWIHAILVGFRWAYPESSRRLPGLEELVVDALRKLGRPAMVYRPSAADAEAEMLTERRRTVLNGLKAEIDGLMASLHGLDVSRTANYFDKMLALSNRVLNAVWDIGADTGLNCGEIPALDLQAKQRTMLYDITRIKDKFTVLTGLVNKVKETLKNERFVVGATDLMGCHFYQDSLSREFEELLNQITAGVTIANFSDFNKRLQEIQGNVTAFNEDLVLGRAKIKDCIPGWNELRRVSEELSPLPLPLDPAVRARIEAARDKLCALRTRIQEAVKNNNQPIVKEGDNSVATWIPRLFTEILGELAP